MLIRRNLSKKIIIIGSGIASLSLAENLSKNQRLQIEIYESGMKNSRFNQKLNRQAYNKIKKQNFYFNEKLIEYSNKTGWLNNLDKLRNRILGGNLNYWGSESQLFNKFDFKANRNGFGHWPISYGEILSYYKKVIKYFNFKQKYITFKESKEEFIECNWSQNYNKKRVKDYLLKKILKRKNVNFFFNSTLIDIKLTNKSLNSCKFNISNKIKFITGDYLILCAGAVENTRIILNANDFKNQMKKKYYNNLGNFFIDHPHGYIGYIKNYTNKFYKKFIKKKKFKYFFSYSGLRLNPIHQKEKLGISFQFRKENRYLKFINHIRNIYISYYNRSYKNIFSEIFIILYKIITFKFFFNENLIKIWCVCEQDPIKNSRIKLYNVFDNNLNKKIGITWKVSPLLKKTFFNVLPRLNSFLKKKYGEVIFNKNLNSDLCGLNGGTHHFGTTRMSSIDKYSFVDKNLKIKNLNNIYILSTSCFPTNGTSNSTLTLLALSLRLSSHLTKLNVLRN
jgi:hypothetical protein